MELAGKTAVVTGGNKGIGREIARGLAARGARVVLAARDAAALDEARRSLAASVGEDRCEGLPLDLADLDAVRDAAALLRARHPRIDLLVNNAGFHTARRSLTKQGHERTLAVCHLAHYLLTRELLPTLPDGARVVTVASEAHRYGRIHWDDLDLAHWSGIAAYCQAKLANVLFARELARREPRLRSYAVHPGSVRTGWARGPESGFFRHAAALAAPFLLTPAQGAATPLHACLAPDLPSGAYLRRRRVVDPSPEARDDASAKRLWDESARRVGLPP